MLTLEEYKELLLLIKSIPLDATPETCAAVLKWINILNNKILECQQK